jgi:hypothetical protein
VDNVDYANRLGCPRVSDDVLIEVPETVLPPGKFVVIMPHTRVEAALLWLVVELDANPLGGIRAVFGQVKKE